MKNIRAIYDSAKVLRPQGVILFRLGDFYEVLFEDAVTVSKALNLVVTERQGVPMVGIPAHAVSRYVKSLEEDGIRVSFHEKMI